jgi:hypothetical protein
MSWTTRFAPILATVIVLGLAVAGCGDSANGDGQSPAGDDTSQSQAGSSEAQDAKEVMALFRELQRRFRAGQAAEFCAAFGTRRRSLDEFIGDAAARQSSCRAAVRRTSRQYRAGTLDWPAHEVDGVTIEEGSIAFVKLVEPDGQSFVNVRFTKYGDRWLPDFTIPNELSGMNAG